MGADSTLVFYGVRYTISQDEIELVEQKLDPRQITARDYGLESWWCRCASESVEGEYYLFIGANLGSVGYEGKFNMQFGRDALASLVEVVGGRLENAGILQVPSLYVQFCPDY